MSDPFVHLRVASGYSMQYGASHPSALVAQAAAHDMDTLALTDRDGLYGAVRFAKACLQQGVAPVIGVDLAVETGGRVTALATSRAGWGSLCRLVTATHLRGERGRPVTTADLIADHADDLIVCLGADSALGAHASAGRRDAAAAELSAWRDRVGASSLVVAATNHRSGGTGVGSATQAGRLVALADQARVDVVLTNMVRMAERRQATTLDVLDATRRLVPLDARHIERRNAEGFLKPGKLMIDVAEEVARLAGRDGRGAERLIGDTRALAIRSRLDPRADIGLGEIHLPEFDVFGTTADAAMRVLRNRCEAGLVERYGRPDQTTCDRLDDELAVIDELGFASYFLTVADVVELVRGLGIRCAARGSGAGSLINYALGISGVDPLAHGLLMERFLSPLRQALPDIDLDVESARRTEIYEKVLDTFGGERVACVAMLETYRVRHAVRDVGAALSLPPVEIDAIATSFPHVRARDARQALRDLPELRAAGLGERRLDVLFELVESLDGLPRHVALHPCGVLLSDVTLGDRTPLEASFGGFPMSQFDKDDVEDLGLLKLDVLGIRMQSAMAHALDEIDRTGAYVARPVGPALTERRPDIDALAPFDDERVYDMIGHRATLGCFQIESPGQRELVGKFGPSTFDDIIIDISLFRPGPVKSDMVGPFLEARQGWRTPSYLHPDLEPILRETGGGVVFHEQLIQAVALFTGCSLAQGDEARRALGDLQGQAEVKRWLWPKALARGYDEATIEAIWDVLSAFASFGFCKAHAAAFALPTYQSAWLKRHYPAHFLAGVLTHDPGMYPKRFLLEEARQLAVSVLGLSINRSRGDYHVEPVAELTASEPLTVAGRPQTPEWGIRLAFGEVKGMSEPEISRLVAGQPYTSLSDVWTRARLSEPVMERLVLAGAFDELYGIGGPRSVTGHDQVTRRDLLLAVADLARFDRADARVASRAKGLRRQRDQRPATSDPRDLARAQSRGLLSRDPVAVQLRLSFDDEDDRDVRPTGLPEMTADERLHAELEILGLDASAHLMGRYLDFLRALGAVSSRVLLQQRNGAEVLVAGVKVATQTPPVRSGRRVIFLTLDDSMGPVDATFFEDVQGPYAATVFSSWLVCVRGITRRTGPRGISLRATGAWDLPTLFTRWQAVREETGDDEAALAAVRETLDTVPAGYSLVGEYVPRGGEPADAPTPDAQQHGKGGGMGQRRVLVHASGFVQSAYADIKPAGIQPVDAPRKLWHSSPGSSGR